MEPFSLLRRLFGQRRLIFLKRWTLFLGLYFCLCLLMGGCGAFDSGAPVPGGAPSNEEQSDGETAQPASMTSFCRVVTADDSQLLLAGADGDRNIYTLSVDDTSTFQPGALVEVTYDGTTLETWPARFGGVSAAEVCEGGFDDRCALYLQVLEDLWETDSGLNGDVTYIGVDLSRTSLSDSERAAVAWPFAGRHGGELVTGTWEELAEQGYIDRENLYWEDGVLFSITEQEMEGTYSLTPVTFDAQKWRSGLGAYFFCDCTSVQSADGHWDGYTFGSQAIS